MNWISQLRRCAARSAVTVLTVAILVTFTSGNAAAEGGGTSSSSVVGRGDILTTITSRLPRVRASSKTRSRAKCRTVVLNDGEIEFLIAFISLNPTAAGAEELARLLRDYLMPPAPPLSVAHPPDPDGTQDHPSEITPPPDSPTDSPPPVVEYQLMVRICSGIARDIWASPRANVGAGSSTALGRSMITRLPEPQPVQSPPLGVPVPVNQPVFITIPGTSWNPVEALLQVQGITAEVRAEPMSLRVYSGDGSGQLSTCPGRGVTFDLLSPLSPARQSLNPGACTITYVHPTDPTAGWTAASAARSTAGDFRTSGFIGAVTVLWSAEWRADGGPWRSLGLIPRTRVFERSVREVRTAISTAAPGRHSK